MVGPSKGSVTRIYKNATGTVIGTDEVTLTFDNIKKNDGNFHWHVRHIANVRTLMHLEGAAADRDIATVNSIGTYSSILENSGNFLVVTWTGGSTTNDVVLTLESHVAIIGDTL